MTRVKKKLTFYIGSIFLLAGMIYGIKGEYSHANWLLLTYITIWMMITEVKMEE